MTKPFFTGIDISDKTLDYCVTQTASAIKSALITGQVENTPDGIEKMLKRLTDQGIKLTDCWFCAEHTGNYSITLCAALEQKQLTYSLIAPLELKRSLGITRGKNDKVDSFRIAAYGLTHQHKLQITKLPETALLVLKELLTYRNLLVKQKVQNQNSLKSHRKLKQLINNDAVQEDHIKRISDLKQSIKQVDKAIAEEIKSNHELNETFKLVSSVKGVGTIISANMLVTTRNFTAFENARKYSCYAGAAPFENSSGKYQGQPRIHPLANRQLRSLLKNGANSAMQYDPELKAYTERKIKDGKKHGVIVNAVVNKLISRVFAVVKRGTPYISTYQQIIKMELA